MNNRPRTECGSAGRFHGSETDSIKCPTVSGIPKQKALKWLHNRYCTGDTKAESTELPM